MKLQEVKITDHRNRKGENARHEMQNFTMLDTKIDGLLTCSGVMK